MRIISGKYKGRIIKRPKGIRPTQDKVRKALFDILQDIAGLSFLELFAGSGAVGIEALSRGIRDLTLVEYNRDCLLAIKNNIESLQLKVCDLYPKEAEEAIRILYNERKKFDIIFLDPPYNPLSSYSKEHVMGIPKRYRQGLGTEDNNLAKKTLQSLEAYDILSPNGLIVVQHFKKDSLPEKIGCLLLFRQSSYGDTRLSFYKKVNPKSQ
jgi:16S rRNA G966 N2-methylase RsmD